MKKTFLFAAMLLTAGMVQAKVVETTFTVRGHCGMCKQRIEVTAGLVEGVKSASYDLKGQSLKLVYDSKKTSPKKVQKAIAAIGYDAGKVKAPQAAYDKLEDCCKYREIDGINETDHHGAGHQHAH